ncbi:ROK family protein [Phycicoccus sp. CSK15P-2]|uniref:ROK family protein n=1 Tax=Phycicoccus sp. CSK15P-2 TaxID=2807627 RepID=UPI001952458A|nr:ROK family protein [Phycicoccus sp. CSK15P-2]MBM6404707.1 ROK family protein [Phycicoccus sp. CSK15P-2]
MSTPTGSPATSGRIARGRRHEEAARQSTLREHNLALVLDRIVGAHAVGSPAPRASIAAEVGLARATVSDLVDRLIGARLVTELAPRAGERAGRPGVPLAPAPRSVVGLGLSVGVDHLAAVVVDLSGITVSERVVEVDLRGSDPDPTLARLADLAADTCRAVTSQGMRVAGACVSLPGLVSRETATLRYAPNLNWHDLAVDAALRTHPDLATLPVTAANDADLAARTEVGERTRRFGVPAEEQNFLLLFGAVGIGASMVLAGRVFQGMHGWGGEIGHVVVDPAGRECPCGARGCLEPYAGRDAMVRGAGLPAGSGSAVLDRLAAASTTAGPAAETVAAAGRALGQAAATVVNVVDVDEVVLGGVYSALHDTLAPHVLTELEQRAVIARWARIRVSSSTGAAGGSARGAALSVLDDVVADPSAWLAPAG